MFAVETYAAVRCFVFIEGKSPREAARVFGWPGHGGEDVPLFGSAGCMRTKAPERPKLGPLTPAIDAILEADKTARQATAHGEADFRTPSDELGFAALHRGEGLRAAPVKSGRVNATSSDSVVAPRFTHPAAGNPPTAIKDQRT